MQTFSIRDLRDRSGDLSREAEEGRLSVVTRHGQPLFVSVPFTDDLLQAGIHVALAVGLFKNHDLSLGKAAKLAGMSLARFTEHVSGLGIAVADYAAAELDAELGVLNAH